MNRSAFLAISLHVIALQVSAAVIGFIPPAPDSTDSVKIDIGGAWYGCSPHGPQVTVREGRIEIAFTTFYEQGGGCLTSSFPWRERVNVGVLPPGVYEVVATVDDYLAGRTLPAGEDTLVVRGADPFRFHSFAVRTTGEAVGVFTQQRIDFTNIDTVRVDGVAAPVAYASSTNMVFAAPPHAPGVVDVQIGDIVQKAALIYIDPAGPPDRFAEEPVLFPLSYEGAGAFGSAWTVENFVGDTQLSNEPIGTGYLRYFVRNGSGGRVTELMNSRLRVTSGGKTTGTEVPVVREEDFRIGTLRLVNVPRVAENARATVRIYAINQPRWPCNVTVSGNPMLHQVALSRYAADRPYMAKLDLVGDLAGVPSEGSTSVNVSCDDNVTPFWAMLTITDNTTQHVTVISPQ